MGANADTHEHDPVQLLRMRMELKAQQEENARLKRLLRERELELERPPAEDAAEDAPVPGAADEDASATDAATIRWFHDLWFRRRPVFKTTFLGVPTWQNPLDAWITQEIVSEARPDLIIETGTFKGGSAALWASLLEITNPDGRVVSIDVQDRVDPRVQRLPAVERRVEFLRGSSTDPRIVSEVVERAGGGRALAILDSDHAAEHVLGELTAYAPLIGVGSYFIVQDVRIGPAVAIERFLREEDRFEPDRSRERFMITNCSGGFLRRVR